MEQNSQTAAVQTHAASPLAGSQYYSAKNWQLFGFALLQGTSNMFMMAMNFSQYIANSDYGIAVITVSLLLTLTRIWDAVTDPIVGFILDHINTPFGRFRPMMALGWVIMVATAYPMFFMGKGHGLLLFAVLYTIYIIGYTILTCINKAALLILTNNPKQRPLTGGYQAVCTMLLTTGVTMYLSMVLYPKYGGLTPDALREMLVTIIIASGVCTLLAILALSEKDRPENISKLSLNATPRLRDCWSTIKGNRPLQMLIVAAATDKLALQIANNSTIGIMLTGIVIGNYAFQGSLSAYQIIPSLLGIFFITQWARTKGSRKAVLAFSWAGIVVCAATAVLLAVIDPTQISKTAVPTALYIVLVLARTVVISGNGALTNVMIADCADYEMYRSGKFMPGLVGTVFSFVDKMFSSLSTTIVGVAVAAIGFKDRLPQIGDPATPALFWVTIFLALGMPMLGWLCSVIALKFYDLTPEKMAEIQKHNAEVRAQAAA